MLQKPEIQMQQSKTVIINRSNVEEGFLDEIKQTLKTAEVEEGRETTVDITIIIGQDYENLQ